jgi:general secretion pathway protein M
MIFSSYIETAHQRLDALEKREKIIVIAGFIFLLFSMFFLLIWEPVFSELDKQQQSYQSQRQLLNWMKGTSQQIQSLRSSGAQSSSRFDKQSISSLVERSSTSLGIKQYITKLDSNKKGVKVQLEQANFDRIILWLHDLESKYGIQSSNIKIEPQEASGTVNAQISLERPTS